jgi:hypothetical protein
MLPWLLVSFVGADCVTHPSGPFSGGIPMCCRLFARTPILAVVIALCLSVSGCAGNKVTKANADKITTGMTEKEVSDILGAPNESAEVEVPELGGIAGAMLGGAMPKKARQSTWKHEGKTVQVTFVDGKVVQKTATGF